MGRKNVDFEDMNPEKVQPFLYVEFYEDSARVFFDILPRLTLYYVAALCTPFL